MGKKNKKSKKTKKSQGVRATGGFCAPLGPLYDFFPTIKASRGGVNYSPSPNFMSQSGEVINMGVSVSKLAQVASLFAFGAALFGNVLFGHGGLELVSAGLFLHVGGDLIEDVLSD